MAKIALEVANYDIATAYGLYISWVERLDGDAADFGFFETYLKPLNQAIVDLEETAAGSDILCGTRPTSNQSTADRQIKKGRAALIAVPEEHLPDITSGLPLRRSELLQAASAMRNLREYTEAIRSMVDRQANETEFQNWLDADGGAYRHSRCSVFGLEFTDFKREGRVEGKAFDILAATGEKGTEHVLIELKSPSSEILKMKESSTNNGPSRFYSLSPSLARSIPQILEYRLALESKREDSPELSTLGLLRPPTIRRCIIVLGVDPRDPREKSIFLETKRSLAAGIEIWTYDDILRRLQTTISNLERSSPASHI